MEEYLYEFYQKVGKEADHRSAEQVMRDVLFWFAGETALRMTKQKNLPN